MTSELQRDIAEIEAALEKVHSYQREDWKRLEAAWQRLKLYLAPQAPPAAVAVPVETYLDFGRYGVSGPHPIIDGKVTVPAIKLLEVIAAERHKPAPVAVPEGMVMVQRADLAALEATDFGRCGWSVRANLAALRLRDVLLAAARKVEP